MSEQNQLVSYPITFTLKPEQITMLSYITSYDAHVIDVSGQTMYLQHTFEKRKILHISFIREFSCETEFNLNHFQYIPLSSLKHYHTLR